MQLLKYYRSFSQPTFGFTSLKYTSASGNCTEPQLLTGYACQRQKVNKQTIILRFLVDKKICYYENKLTEVMASIGRMKEQAPSAASHDTVMPHTVEGIIILIFDELAKQLHSFLLILAVQRYR
jgi:hypothetical protein